MLRIAFAILLLANLGYYLWNHGALAPLGLGAVAQEEPQRLNQQIQPEALHIAGNPVAQSDTASSEPVAEPVTTVESAPTAAEPAEQAPSPTPAPAVAVQASAPPAPPPPPPAPKEPTSCWMAGGLDERQADGVRRAFAALPRDQWQLDANHQSGRWMVYMGKFPDAEFLDRKRGELRAMNVDFDRAGGNLEPGLSLGRFSSEEAAGRQLATLTRQGVRTARVVQERPEVTTYTLRLPKITPTAKASAVSLAGKNLDARSLRSCGK